MNTSTKTIKDEIERAMDLWRNSPHPEKVRDKVIKAAKCVLPNHIKIDSVLTSYETERRKYHNLSHLWDMISIGTDELVLPECSYPQDFMACVLGHDIAYQYNSLPQENEVTSAIWTTALFQPTLHEADRIGHAIWATAKHGEDITDWASPLAKELVDRDIYSYAKPWYEFKANSFNVIEEIFYCAGEACKPTSREQILQNQKKFYSHMLTHRPVMYYRHCEWESQARTNLSKYIKEVTLDASREHSSEAR